MYKIKIRYKFLNDFLVSWENKNVGKLLLHEGAEERKIKGIFI